MMDKYTNVQTRPVSTADGVELQEQTDFSLLHVTTRGDRSMLADALAARLNASVSRDPNTAATNAKGERILWFGPSSWLLHAPVPDFQLAAIPGCAITDLSDSRRLFTLRGDTAGECLVRYCPLDLQSDGLAPGHCALTQFEQFPLLLHVNANCDFDLYVERSYAEDFLSLLNVKAGRP